MIVKTAGYPVPDDTVCPFSDVAVQHGEDPLFLSKYVAVGAAKEITLGETPTTNQNYVDRLGYMAEYNDAYEFLKMLWSEARENFTRWSSEAWH